MAGTDRSRQHVAAGPAVVLVRPQLAQNIGTAARAWLVAAGSLIEARGFVSSPVERHLADVAPTVRALLGLPADETPGSGAVLSELLPQKPSARSNL